MALHYPDGEVLASVPAAGLTGGAGEQLLGGAAITNIALYQ